MRRPKLPTCPEAGRGVHRWLFICCLKLHEAGLPPEKWEAIIEPLATRPLQPGEVDNAARTICSGVVNMSPRWPGINWEKRAQVLAGPGSMQDLEDANPYRPAPRMGRSPKELLTLLYPETALLCCGASSSTFTTQPLSQWPAAQLASLQFIVPNPMLAKVGRTQSGKLSSHCLEATGPRVYQVVEFDAGTFDDHAKILLYLGQYAPLAMVVHSGGKSLHGWFNVAGEPEASVQRFMELAVNLGADRATWTRSQFVRMPDGRRANGNIQKVVYFNPENCCQIL